MNKKQNYQIISERIDDIVLLLSVMKQMKGSNAKKLVFQLGRLGSAHCEAIANLTWKQGKIGVS